MKFPEPKYACASQFLNLNHTLTLNPSSPESKIKMKIMTKRGDA